VDGWAGRNTCNEGAIAALRRGTPVSGIASELPSETPSRWHATPLRPLHQPTPGRRTGLGAPSAGWVESARAPQPTSTRLRMGFMTGFAMVFTTEPAMDAVMERAMADRTGNLGNATGNAMGCPMKE